MAIFSEQQQLDAARQLFTLLAPQLNRRISVQLWDGSLIPLGENSDPDYFIAISGAGVLGSLMRKPSYENLLFHYANGTIEIHGDLINFVNLARQKQPRDRSKRPGRLQLLKTAFPLLFAPTDKIEVQHSYNNDAVGRKESRRKNMDFIQFHYDISNEFYALFLGKEMQYSCGYFTDPNNSIDQAQFDKLDMICKKLRLKAGDKFLDIGCGWGGLVCHAAQHYGVQAHGVTLSKKQFDFTTEKIKRLGLQDQITIELKDYEKLEGSFDKISSVGMFEHIGIDNMEKYFKKINSLLRDRGILLNHGISRHAKPSTRAGKKIRRERRLLLKYIFPGSELDNVGHTIDMMEISGFEVHDMEAWREHYALTCQHWYRQLMQRKDEAIALVGKEKFNMWTLYLAGVAIGFTDGSMHICQVVASKRASKGPSGVPLTRADLYR
ncbi:class I SAM-dependent methyltransferase [Mariprofundus sp. NF]|uniref:SAM-dependent methyltransferase n=1 Tax=Mariprofundus sp. NF TaxID=2608716 RepID=UPI0015A18BE3|nr:cyclopropane-fatty-acyl-phospholipid synthase family protein [Mariprofundus sp. NF]NWF37880.1 class I SAM-dependent methyltransferase [Mariprofundus sp. NF]